MILKQIKLFLVIVFIASINLEAQTSSTISRFGLGDLNYSFSARRMGIGQLGTSIADADFISTLNPASLFRIGKTRIEFAADYRGTFLSDNNRKNYFAEGDFGGFAIGIPISPDNGIVAAFGLIPYSNVSYKVVEHSSSSNPLIGDYTVNYLGDGGLSKVFLSTSYLLPFNFALGASFDYYFGNVNYTSLIEFANTSSYSSEYKKHYEYFGGGGTVGFITPDISKMLELNSISDFRAGLSLGFLSKLKYDSLFSASSLAGVDTLNIGRSEASIPSTLSVGLSFVLKNKYLFCVDYSSQAWSKFKQNNFTSPELRNANKISGGFEYRPARELGSTFWEQIILRAGLSYEQTQYVINNNGVDQFSVSLGMSLPLSYENTLDFGLSYSKRGSKDLNLLQEDIIKLAVGFSLGELWFIRQEK